MNTSVEFQARNIQFLEFELNNQCQYTKIHTWCPRNRLGNEPEIFLSTDIIKDVINYFKKYDFSGSVYFSIYNEPLLDNRLMGLIKYTKEQLPKCTIQMYTNGLLLSQEKAQSLIDAGLDILRISNYGNAPQIPGAIYADRLQLAPNDSGYDDRINIYDKKANCNDPCYMPMQYFCINCNGFVMLCWDDWKNTCSIGNLNDYTIDDILLSKIRLDKIEQLKSGERQGVCSGCDRPTEMCISEYRGRLKL